MNKFDIKATKFILIIISICVAFAVVVMQAYQYIPEENNNQEEIEEINENYQQENLNNDEKEENQEDIEQDRLEQERERLERERFEQEQIELESLENEKEQKNRDYIGSTDFESLINTANEMKLSNEYEKAIENYKKAAEISDDKDKAFCYEQISTIYAIQKRYGTALSFAQKAYNTYPNTSREILLARLYYKTGNIDKATNRVNNILKRDFDLDR